MQQENEKIRLPQSLQDASYGLLNNVDLLVSRCTLYLGSRVNDTLSAVAEQIIKKMLKEPV